MLVERGASVYEPSLECEVGAGKAINLDNGHPIARWIRPTVSFRMLSSPASILAIVRACN